MRITPAYAGKSFGGWLKHARQVGSPPPMRGKVLTNDNDDRRQRITPAYAGKSCICWQAK